MRSSSKAKNLASLQRLASARIFQQLQALERRLCFARRIGKVRSPTSCRLCLYIVAVRGVFGGQ